jgi:L-fucose isomerase-like protein
MRIKESLMTARTEQDLRVGFLAIGRKRPGFDPEWGQKMAAAAWDACEGAPLHAVRPAEPVVDDATLRQAITQFRQAGCQTLLVLQPTMGDGRLAPILAQLWDDPLVLWATPERLDTDRVSACSLVGTHVFASTLRQMQRPFEIVYGAGDDESTRRQVVTAARLTAAAAQLRRAKVGLVGYHAPGFVNVHADPIAISRELGAQLQHFGLTEFQARVESCDAERIESDLQVVLDMHLPMDDDLGPGDLAPNSSYYLALSDLMAEENLNALAVRCWPELPKYFGHWPYLAMMRLTEEGCPVALEGDVDGAILGMLGKLLGICVGYISDWLEHDDRSITLWHPGHAPRDVCVPQTLRLGRHFNNDKPLVVNAQLSTDQPITLARLWRCDGRYQMTAFNARTAAPRRPLLGAHGLAVVDGRSVPERFDQLCHAGMPHHVTVFSGSHVDLLRRLARLMGVEWLD